MSTVVPKLVTREFTSPDASHVEDYSIRTNELSLWYGDFQALMNVSVNIKKGIITGLIGPSGCGKTTLLRCFNRINERYGNVTTTGDIEILDKNIYDADVSVRQLRRSVGMVFQRPNPLPISIYDNVLFGMGIHDAFKSLPRVNAMTSSKMHYAKLICGTQ